mmetsp:Transcript_3188/g.6992  ORF Transcript_3188/g.6992 Transcript_3188/m.6992 type:complete len:227 (-) Transcript_3188:2009-2689(-)
MQGGLVGDRGGGCGKGSYRGGSEDRNVLEDGILQGTTDGQIPVDIGASVNHQGPGGERPPDGGRRCRSEGSHRGGSGNLDALEPRVLGRKGTTHVEVPGQAGVPGDGEQLADAGLGGFEEVHHCFSTDGNIGKGCCRVCRGGEGAPCRQRAPDLGVGIDGQLFNRSGTADRSRRGGQRTHLGFAEDQDVRVDGGFQGGRATDVQISPDVGLVCNQQALHRGIGIDG